jgi:hypothetical protein
LNAILGGSQTTDDKNHFSLALSYFCPERFLGLVLVLNWFCEPGLEATDTTPSNSTYGSFFCQYRLD